MAMMQSAELMVKEYMYYKQNSDKCKSHVILMLLQNGNDSASTVTGGQMDYLNRFIVFWLFILFV